MNMMNPFYTSLSMTAVALSFATPTFADDTATPPVALQVDEVTPATGFPVGAATDILGVRIGMTMAEAEAAFAALNLPLIAEAPEIPDAGPVDPKRVGYAYRTGEVTPNFVWPDGFQMTFEPVRSSAGMTMYVELEDAIEGRQQYVNGQMLWVSFGGPSVGARVQEVVRSHVLPEPVDTQVMIDSITQKYGEPSYLKERQTFWIEIAYYYQDGNLVAQDDRYRSRITRNCKGGIGRQSDILYSDETINGWYGNWSDPRLSQDHCEAGIFVRLYFGDVPNTIDKLDVLVIDNIARWENASSISQQAEEVHAKWLLSVAGSTEAPDL